MHNYIAYDTDLYMYISVTYEDLNRDNTQYDLAEQILLTILLAAMRQLLGICERASCNQVTARMKILLSLQSKNIYWKSSMLAQKLSFLKRWCFWLFTCGMWLNHLANQHRWKKHKTTYKIQRDKLEGKKGHKNKPT